MPNSTPPFDAGTPDEIDRRVSLIEARMVGAAHPGTLASLRDNAENVLLNVDLPWLIAQVRARSSAPVGYEAGCYDDAHIIGPAASCLCGALALLKRRDGTQFVMLDRVLRDAWAARSSGEGHEGAQFASPLSAERIAPEVERRLSEIEGRWNAALPARGEVRVDCTGFNEKYVDAVDEFLLSCPSDVGFLIDQLRAVVGSGLSVSERKEPTDA